MNDMIKLCLVMMMVATVGCAKKNEENSASTTVASADDVTFSSIGYSDSGERFYRTFTFTDGTLVVRSFYFPANTSNGWYKIRYKGNYSIAQSGDQYSITHHYCESELPCRETCGAEVHCEAWKTATYTARGPWDWEMELTYEGKQYLILNSKHNPDPPGLSPFAPAQLDPDGSHVPDF